MDKAITTVTETPLLQLSPVSVPAEEQADAKLLHKLLAANKADDTFQIVTPNGGVAIIPRSMFDVWERVAELMADGSAVSVVSVDNELTLEQAADLLNESYSEMEKLIENGEIPVILQESGVKVRTEDVLAYKQARYEKRREGLRELTKLSQLYGGYDELSH